MFVNTNVAALNAWQNLLNTQQDMTSTLQQLSSGYRINSAADGPAALAISEQMQNQINGLNQAYQNAQNAISMLQTADGALAQIQNILQTMYSLATQAAQSTNVGVDRASLQSQMNQYTQEIDSITNQTAFNTKNLLDGVLGTVNLAVGANPNQELQFTLAGVDAVSLGVAGTVPASVGFSTTTTAATYGFTDLSLFGATSTTQPYGSYGLQNNTYQIAVTAATYANATINNSNITYTIGTFGSGATVAGIDTEVTNTTGTSTTVTAGSLNVNGLSTTANTSVSVQLEVITTATYSSTGASVAYTIEYSINGGPMTTLTNTATWPTSTLSLGNSGVSINFSDLSAPTWNFTTSPTQGVMAYEDTYNMTVNPQSVELALEDQSGNIIGSAIPVVGSATTNLALGNANDGQAVGITFNPQTFFSAYYKNTSTLPTPFAFQVAYAQNSTAVGAGGTVFQNASVAGGLSVMNYAQATVAQQAIQAALTQIDGERAQVGSLIDRLNQAASDLQTSQLNLTSARGILMDADMALEMAQLSKDQVLQQSGVAMLAQANAVPQALLKLFP